MVDKYLKKLALEQSLYDGNLNYVKIDDKIVIIVLYKDDLFIIRNDTPEIRWIKMKVL